MMQVTPARILIVEDEAITASTLEQILTTAGYEVAGRATTGRDAISLATTLKPDIILMDIMLADNIDGIEASRAITAKAAIPVIFITSHDDSKTMQACQSADPFGFIRKPCDERELVIVIETALYRHKAEREKVAHSQRMALILENIGEALLCCLPDGTIDYLNPAGEELLDCRLPAVFGHTLSSVLTLEDPAGQKITLPDPASLPAETPVRTASGKRFIGSFHCTPLPDQSGTIIVIRNENQRILAEKNLRESERQFRQLVELSPEAIFVIDADEIVFMNAAGQHLLDLPEDASPPLASRLFQGIAIQDAGADWSRAVESTLVLPSGGSIDTEILATAINFRGRKCTQLICQNITARKQKMEAERQAHKMEAIGRLAGGIAHDFNNILTAILGYAELTQLKIPKDGPGQEEVEQIRQAADRASGLTRQLLAFSRRQVLQYRLLDIEHVVQEMEKLLRRVIGENITLKILHAKNIPAIMADASQMQLVVINLAVNARDAMPDGGTLTIQTKLGQSATGEDEVVLIVSDTGSGMSEEVRRHLFEPFFTTKSPGHGTGLGLSTVYGIITQSGGRVHIESSTGAGTSVTITLPAADPNSLQSVPEQEILDPHGVYNETILLIEDDPLVRALAATFLKRKGYLVLEADNGSSGLALAQTHIGRIDLLLTDMILPEKSGEKIAQDIRSMHPETLVLFISGYGDPRTENPETTHQPRLLQKPFTGSELLLAVSQVLARQDPA